MERNLLVKIDCGERTCDSCPHILQRPFSKIVECRLFHQDLSSDDQRNDGKLVRCAKCIGAQEASVTQDYMVLCDAWGRFHHDSMMFDYPRYSWGELMRKIKNLP